MRQYYLVSVLLGMLFLLSSTIFIVDQRSYAVIFQFGEAVRVIDTPGLKMQIPFIQRHDFYDKRLLSVDVEAKELTASDGKRVIVDAFARFKITDPVMFYKTVNNYQNIKIRINKILESAMRKVIGRVPLISLLSNERSNIMLQIRDTVNSEGTNFGITILDVRIMHADLPKENSAAIYQRMQTDRQKEAMQIRAEGQEESAKIKSTADKESKIIISDAYVLSETIKGEGDGIAAKLYNDTYGKDPEFYKFYRTLVVYKNSLNDASFIINPESTFLKYLGLEK